MRYFYITLILNTILNTPGTSRASTEAFIPPDQAQEEGASVGEELFSDQELEEAIYNLKQELGQEETELQEGLVEKGLVENEDSEAGSDSASKESPTTATNTSSNPRFKMLEAEEIEEEFPDNIQSNHAYMMTEDPQKNDTSKHPDIAEKRAILLQKIASDSAMIEQFAAQPEDQTEQIITLANGETVKTAKNLSVKVLNKLTGKTKDVELKINQLLMIDDLYFDVKTAYHLVEVDPATHDRGERAFIELWRKDERGDLNLIFSNWMFSRYPELSCIEDYKYDVLLAKCE